jgi:acyl-CoA synthetase (NDP forming)
MSIRQRIKNLEPFFKPANVAIIGASRVAGKAGYNIIENLKGLGYQGKIYPVNPSAIKILGLTAYPNLKSLPEIPDLVIIVLPPGQVLKSIEACAAKGVKAIIIESAGFGEMDSAGAKAEARIKELAKQAGIRVMGPNSVGTINPYSNFDSSLGRLKKIFLPKDKIRQGTVAFIGQTGLFTGVYLPLINSEIGISKIACLGNKCDVDESDMLEYCGEDSRTKVIAMYLESIKDGQRFLKLAHRIVREKPIIVLKSAVTSSGAKASATHTGSVAGEDNVYNAAFRQAGIIRVGSFEQLWDVTRAFVHAPLPRGNRVAIVNLAGSSCVTSVDACIKHGLKIAELSPATKEKIKTVYPDWFQVRSPIDVWVAIEASGFEKTYKTITRATMEDEGVDAVIIVTGANNWLEGKSVPRLFSDIKQDFPQKPLLAVSMPGDQDIYLKMQQGFQNSGIPCYTQDEDAITSMAALYRYQQYLNNT